MFRIDFSPKIKCVFITKDLTYYKSIKKSVREIGNKFTFERKSYVLIPNYIPVAKKRRILIYMIGNHTPLSLIEFTKEKQKEVADLLEHLLKKDVVKALFPTLNNIWLYLAFGGISIGIGSFMVIFYLLMVGKLVWKG